MASRLPEGAALLVAGARSLDESRLALSTVHTLGQIGETLLATGASWRIRRLSPASGERYAPDRANLKMYLDELVEPATVAVLVIAADMTRTADGPAIVTGNRYREYPDEATLPLSWVNERIRACRASRKLVLVSGRARDDQRDDRRDDHTRSAPAGEWLDALGTTRAGDVIAVDAGGGNRALDALLAGLCGEALDPRTGTVTMRSISEHLARSVTGLALQASPSSETLITSPPLGGLWAVRPSQTQRPATTRAMPDEPDDLSGVVLPGRFRVESKLASGSFGTVYRARQLSVERDVAIKVLHANIDLDSDDGRLFVHEIQSVGRIDHTNVVRIHQADITPDGRLFFAMELLVGRDLQEILNQEGVLARDRAVALTRQLLAGLGAAHEAGLVHADVKPANAFVVSGRDGERVVLLDFGLARLRPSGRPAESAGGTPAYMAPEQLNDWRVDHRSDLFAAGLVLVTLLCGWRRRSQDEIRPPLDGFADPELSAVLERALSLDPTERFQNATDFADALAGKRPTSSQAATIRPPFRHLAPFTERDRGRLFGRERDIAELTEYVLYRRAVIYTAPSGAGKTSLLRAGLVPHLESLGARPVYLVCRPGASAALASAIRPGAASVAEAVASWQRENNGRLVLILDQLEAVLSSDPPTGGQRASGDDPAELVKEVLGLGRLPADADVSVVLSVREDFLARVIGGSRRLDEGVPVLRLGPLRKEGALAAIVGPLNEQRLTIAPDLLEALLADLEAAARAISPEMGWGPTAAAYPPHLQLACSVLYEALGPGEATLTLDHYHRLGGFDAIVAEHLDRVLDSELDPDEAVIARDLFLTLVTGANTRALRTEAELIDIAGSRHGALRVSSVLETLRARGLLVRLRGSGGEPSWELVHDSLVPRVLAWVDRRDLDRRRAVELVRYHLRRSQPESPSLLGRAELRELRANPEAIAELEAEWSRRSHDGSWKPAALVARSRRALRRRDLLLAGIGLAVVTTTGVAIQRWRSERAGREREATLRDRDMGRFTLELAPFDWNPDSRQPVPVSPDALPGLRWQLHGAHPERAGQPGQALVSPLLVRGRVTIAPDRTSRIEQVEARGGTGFLVIDGRGTGRQVCPPSIVSLRRLPGYAERRHVPPVMRVRLPTCQATRHGMQTIPAGLFVFGGLGTPPSPDAARPDALRPERNVELPTFQIDRTEVSNAAFRVFAEMERVTGVAMPAYPDSLELRVGGEPARPVVYLTWSEARAFCLFMGKDLPTTEQWEKAVRGGPVLPDGQPNPHERRNLPWGTWQSPAPARLSDTGDKVSAPAAPVGSFPGDRSPYGVLDLAGNVMEWTRSPSTTRSYWITRGGGWESTSTADLVDYMAIHNARPEGARFFYLGMRCAMEGE
jgi:formylglycine-generating enzyme required for sulfatase activity